MFGLFGQKAARRTDLIKKLLTYRLQSRGELSPEAFATIKSIAKSSALALPEGDIAVIVEAAVEGQKQGIPLHNVLAHQEGFRKLQGGNPLIFEQIRHDATGDNPFAALVDYCRYRNHILQEKTPAGFLEPFEIERMVSISYEEICTWD